MDTQEIEVKPPTLEQWLVIAAITVLVTATYWLNRVITDFEGRYGFLASGIISGTCTLIGVLFAVYVFAHNKRTQSTPISIELYKRRFDCFEEVLRDANELLHAADDLLDTYTTDDIDSRIRNGEVFAERQKSFKRGMMTRILSVYELYEQYDKVVKTSDVMVKLSGKTPMSLGEMLEMVELKSSLFKRVSELSIKAVAMLSLGDVDQKLKELLKPQQNRK